MKHILGPNSRSTLTNVQEGDSQPNAVDLRLDKVFKILPTVFEISNDHKKHRQTEEVLPDEGGYFNLEPSSYEVVMENIISVGSGDAGWIKVRSTLNRASCHVQSGIFDAGYHGVVAACLHVNTGLARIKKGTRIAQFVLFNAETLHLYSGSYGFGADGKPKADEAKYHS
jgi:dUTP pyrophosphatase